MCTQRLHTFAVMLWLGVSLGFSVAGCGAIDELDKSAALLEKSGPATAPKAVAADEAKKLKRLGWDNVKSINTSEIDASIIRCSIHGSVTFTRSDDCLAQGGTPSKI